MLRLIREVPPSEPVIKFKDVYCGYNNATNVLHGINVEIKKGECVAFVGNNGSGKTTFFKLITRVLRPRKGEIFVNGFSKSNLDDIRGKVGFLFQNPDEQLFTNSVIDEVSFGPRQLKIAVDCNEMLRLFGLEKHRLQQPYQLSRGERQRLAFICVLAMQPEIIILDEPTTGLDYKNWVRLMDTAMQANREGKTIIFSTHNIQVVQRYAKRVIRLEEGKISGDEIRK